MFKTKYTPGPWDVDIASCAEPELYYTISPGGDPCIALVERWNADLDDTEALQEAEANARLIAAAPSLLAAAERALNELEIYEISVPEDESTAKAVMTLRAAIGLATGETSSDYIEPQQPDWQTLLQDDQGKPLPEYGSYYRVHNGCLETVPMMYDGSPELFDGQINWSEVDSAESHDPENPNDFMDRVNKLLGTNFMREDIDRRS